MTSLATEYEDKKLSVENQVARDLWRQIFNRASTAPLATLHDPGLYNETREQKKLTKAFKEAGWSEKAIAARFDALVERRQTSNNDTSPGVGLGLEKHLHEIASRIEAQMSAMGLSSHRRIALGIDPKAGVSASLTNVIMTNEGIVSVSSFLFRWCGLIARAFVRTLHLDVLHWSESPLEIREDMRVLLRRPDLVIYWAQIFSSYAITGTHGFVPFLPCRPSEVVLFEQIAWAMEFFVVAHEFGHHARDHRTADADPKAQEFEADEFAMKVSERLVFEPFPAVPNPYATTGAAATLMLHSLEILRMFEGHERLDVPNTHSATEERVRRIGYRHVLQPDIFARDQDFNRTVSRIMRAVGEAMTVFLEEGGAEWVRETRLDLHS